MSESSMSDTQFTKLFATMITLMFCLTLFLVVLAHINSGEVMAKLKTEKQAGIDKIVAERVQPVGQIQVGEAVAEPAATTVAAATTTAASAAKSGADVYQASCFACHGTGVAGAPKVGDAAAWTDRIATGNDVLYDHAINGYTGKSGMMPAKGGNAALSDDEVRAAVEHMVSQ